MKRLAYSLAASLVAACMATAAHAATYINYGPTGPDGGFTINFGNTGIGSGEFTDTFEFTMPTGRADFVITSTMSGGSQRITFSDIAFNGEDFETRDDWNDFGFLNNVRVTLGADQRLVITGISGGNAAYTGIITFLPTVSGAVPEPATWALMIGGFAGAGALLRRNRRGQDLPAAA